jgi:hypothetical protein
MKKRPTEGAVVVANNPKGGKFVEAHCPPGYRFALQCEDVDEEGAYRLVHRVLGFQQKDLILVPGTYHFGGWSAPVLRVPSGYIAFVRLGARRVPYELRREADGGHQE